MLESPMASAPPLEAPAAGGLGLRARFRALLSGDGRPVALGAAVALGIFLGCSPFYGLQTVLVFALAAAFRLNPFAAFLGSQISFPPLGLALTSAEVALGEWLRFGRWAVPQAASARELARWLWGHALLSWALGALVLGGALAAVGGLLAFGLFSVFKAWRGSGRSS